MVGPELHLCPMGRPCFPTWTLHNSFTTQIYINRWKLQIKITQKDSLKRDVLNKWQMTPDWQRFPGSRWSVKGCLKAPDSAKRGAHAPPRETVVLSRGTGHYTLTPSHRLLWSESILVFTHRWISIRRRGWRFLSEWGFRVLLRAFSCR